MFPQCRDYIKRDRLKSGTPEDGSSVEGDEFAGTEYISHGKKLGSCWPYSLVASGEGLDCPFGSDSHASSSPTDLPNDSTKFPFPLDPHIRENTHNNSYPIRARDTGDPRRAVQANKPSKHSL